MSWIEDISRFAKQLLTLESRVEVNSEEIKELRQDLKTLTAFTQKVAYFVKRNEEKRIDQQGILTRDLKIELLELERRLSSRGAPLQLVEGGQKRLPENPDENQG